MSDRAETIGDRLRKVRGALSQDELASQLGVHAQTIGKYERDISLPGGDVLARLHHVFGIDLNWLLTGSGSSPTSIQPAASQKQTLDGEDVLRLRDMLAIVGALAEFLDEEGMELTPKGWVDMVEALYRMMRRLQPMQLDDAPLAANVTDLIRDLRSLIKS